MLMILALAVVCTNPANYGAVPDDGNDDTLAFQAAVDATQPGGEMCVDRLGHYQVTRQPKGWNRSAAINTHSKGLTVTCSPDVSIDLVGDQGLKSTILWSIDGGAENITFRGCTFTSSGAWNTDEQTHILATTPVCSVPLGTCTPIRNITIDGIRCIHPKPTPPLRSGDCIRLLGSNMDTRVIGVLIQNSYLYSGRAGVEFQRGLQDVVVRDNIIDGPVDQGLDGEASGLAPGLEVINVQIYRNRFICRSDTQGDHDISMTSGIGLEVYGNSMCRGIKVVRTTFVHIHDQPMKATAATSEGTIEVSNICDGLNIHDNDIERSGVEGPVVRMVGHAGNACNNVSVSRNVLTQRTASFGVYNENGSSVGIRENAMVWKVPAPNATAAYARGTIVPINGFTVTGNMVFGVLRAAVALDSSRFPVVSPVLSANSIGSLPLCTGGGCSGASL